MTQETPESTPQKKLLDILRGLEPLGSEDWFLDDTGHGLLPAKTVNL